MGSSSSIPLIDLSKGMVPGTETWRRTCEKMREAGERLGCFMVTGYDMPAGLVETAFGAARQLFDLPTENKRRNTSHKPYCGYEGRTEKLDKLLSLEDEQKIYSGLKEKLAATTEEQHRFSSLLKSFQDEYAKNESLRTARAPT